MKIVAISDLHGYLPKDLPSGDILIIAGDISPLNIQRNRIEMEEWIFTVFIDWINSLSYESVYIVAGNHDHFFTTITDTQRLELKLKTKYKLNYLEDEQITYIDTLGKKWKIFGTPNCHQFGNWAYMYSDETLEQKFKNIPDEVDILISHDPPYNVGFTDAILQKPYSRSIGPQHCGNTPLRSRLENINYKFCFVGHIHSGDHTLTKFGSGYVVNVSLLDENYQLNYKPLELETNEY